MSTRLDFAPLWDFFGKKIVFFARCLLGTPRFHPTARLTSAPSLVNCSTFIWWLHSLMGIELEQRAIDQRRQGTPVQMDNVRAGDLVFTTGSVHDYWYEDEPDMAIGHVALATGGGTVIHATRQGVTEEDFTSLLSKRKFRDVCRIVPNEDDFYTFQTHPVWEVRSTIDIRWLILQNL